MSEPRWKQRYRAPSLTLPRWAPDDPDHLVYVSNLSGSWQVHAWDRAADRHRQVSDHPTGVVAGGLGPPPPQGGGGGGGGPGGAVFGAGGGGGGGPGGTPPPHGGGAAGGAQ